ncbi:hypothetical protein IFM89_024925 [Coptis chinensis]|uniref:ABC1 atypical kinase-like domain-containing protein n=1 Tax=Coptis chinensis TaxID=261450 RepID=A0A835H8N3_9MAGN|nr:hypothetical protein IFM89_024925 [Coptis chinensis]
MVNQKFEIGYEFDFLREAEAMERIQRFLCVHNKKPPVLVPSVVRNMVTRKVLVMDFVDGIPILNLGDEIAKRGINPGGKVAAAAKQNILKSLMLVYGQMILKSGFFHADPHPGNILICKGSQVALLDYGQVKDLPDNLRLGFANMILAIADDDPTRASQSYRQLGIETLSKCKDEQKEMLKLAQSMFDTKLPAGSKMLQPFSEDSSLKKIAVRSFPEELFCVLRTVHLLRGLSVGMGINISCAEQWRSIAEEALYDAGRNEGKDLKGMVHKRGFGLTSWTLSVNVSSLSGTNTPKQHRASDFTLLSGFHWDVVSLRESLVPNQYRFLTNHAAHPKHWVHLKSL